MGPAGERKAQEASDHRRQPSPPVVLEDPAARQRRDNAPRARQLGCRHAVDDRLDGEEMDHVGTFAAQQPIEPDAIAEVRARIEAGRVDRQRERARAQALRLGELGRPEIGRYGNIEALRHQRFDQRATEPEDVPASVGHKHDAPQRQCLFGGGPLRHSCCG